MCGIVGYIGKRKALPILINGLKRLEYRGYDSAGVALLNKNSLLKIYKAKGKVSNLEKLTATHDMNESVGIAHTRWATHGEPSERNAHPHCSSSGRFALVHNGIIENYIALKDMLKTKGYQFKSDTDTEVLVQFIDYICSSQSLDLLTGIKVALRSVVGAYAIAVLDKFNPGQLIAARKSSPLVVGIGKNEYFISSDVTPLADYTNQVVYLKDEEIAVVSLDDGLKVENLHEGIIIPDIKTIDVEISKLEKGDYPHYMLKEIFEQPDCLIDCMRGRVNIETYQLTLSAVETYKERVLRAQRIIIVACGTSWHAGLIGKYLLENYCRIPVMVEYASEFRYSNPIISPEDVVIAISQSGETADTLAALELAKEKGAFVYGICNVVGSSIPRNTHTGSYIHVGPEIGVASTKAFTGQVLVLAMLAFNLGRSKGTIDELEFKELLKALHQLPQQMKLVLKQNNRIADLAKIFTYATNIIYLGRGFNYPVALEGALKLKEISYIHAEGYPAAEMKHGPIALIDSEMPVVVIATHNGMYDKILSNVQEIKARKGKIIAIVTEGDCTIGALADEVIEVPPTLECLEPLNTIIPLQLLAYHVAICKGKDVDKPRNLAKSVTVE